MMPRERRYRGVLVDEYRLVKLSYPHIDEFQGRVGECVRRYREDNPECFLRILEIGCGDGLTTDVILSVSENMKLVAIDIEPEMIKKAEENLTSWKRIRQFELVVADALTFLRSTSEGNYDIVTSAWTLHNFNTSYRISVLKLIYKALKPKGLFVNGDKFAASDDLHHEHLVTQMRRFFEAYIPIGQYEFLKDFVIHNLHDESPRRIMKEIDYRRDLHAIGFVSIQDVYRELMEVVYIAKKPG